MITVSNRSGPAADAARSSSIRPSLVPRPKPLIRMLGSADGGRKRLARTSHGDLSYEGRSISIRPRPRAFGRSRTMQTRPRMITAALIRYPARTHGHLEYVTRWVPAEKGPSNIVVTPRFATGSRPSSRHVGSNGAGRAI